MLLPSSWLLEASRSEGSSLRCWQPPLGQAQVVVFPPYHRLLLLWVSGHRYAHRCLPNLSLSSLPALSWGHGGASLLFCTGCRLALQLGSLHAPHTHTLCILFQRLGQPAPCPSLLLSYLFLFYISFCELPEKGRNGVKFETLGRSVLWLVWDKVVNFP